jgi:nitrate reductase gamma subunit
MSGTNKSKAHLASGSSLLAQFPFTRLTDAGIADLFHTYKVQLGSDTVQRDIIISSIRGMQRDNFGSIME